MFKSVESQGHASGRKEITFLTCSQEAQNPENVERGKMFQIQDTSSVLSRYFWTSEDSVSCSTY